MNPNGFLSAPRWIRGRNLLTVILHIDMAMPQQQLPVNRKAEHNGAQFERGDFVRRFGEQIRTLHGSTLSIRHRHYAYLQFDLLNIVALLRADIACVKQFEITSEIRYPPILRLPPSPRSRDLKLSGCLMTEKKTGILR
jgi:hypothetical protein